MSQNTLQPDDPRLTAYALGELDEQDRVAVEAELQQNPAARAVIEGIRATAAQLSAALATEPLPVVKPVTTTSQSGNGNPYQGGPFGKKKLIQFPQFYYVIGLAAAACFAVVAALIPPTRHPAPVQKQYTEITFATPPDSGNSDSPASSEKKATELAAREEAVAISPTAVAPHKDRSPFSRSVTVASRRNRALVSVNAKAQALDNAFMSTLQNPLSTFVVNVDTTAFANVRKFLESGARPPAAAVRIEELVNYFAYDYMAPKDDKPFAASLEVASAPWSPSHRLVRIGLKSREATSAEQASGTTTAVAKDVNVQVEFNPEKVASYRLLGYENPTAEKSASTADKVASEDVAAGHTVTALYEVVPVAKRANVASTTPAPAQEKNPVVAPASRMPVPIEKPTISASELLTVKVNYKKPDSPVARKLEFPLTDKGAMFADASNDFKFAAAVAGFGMVLRDSPHKGATTLGDVIDWAEPGAAKDSSGRRAEFIGLVRQAQTQMR